MTKALIGNTTDLYQLVLGTVSELWGILLRELHQLIWVWNGESGSLV